MKRLAIVGVAFGLVTASFAWPWDAEPRPMTRARAEAIWNEHYPPSGFARIAVSPGGREQTLRAWTLPDLSLGQLVGKHDLLLIHEIGGKGRKDISAGLAAFFDKGDVRRLPHALAKLNLRPVDARLESQLVRALGHRRYEVRSATAIALMDTRNAGFPAGSKHLVIRNLREALSRETHADRLQEAGLGLWQLLGKASKRDLQWAQRRTRATSMDLELVQAGDTAALPRVRNRALHDYLALDALLRARGKLERPVAIAGLRKNSQVRLRSAQWLASWGDKAAVAAMTEAARTNPPDMENSSDFRTVNTQISEMARLIGIGRVVALPAEFHLRSSSSGLRPRLRHWDIDRLMRY